LEPGIDVLACAGETAPEHPSVMRGLRRRAGRVRPNDKTATFQLGAMLGVGRCGGIEKTSVGLLHSLR
jgi:hypothetical protein